MVEASKTQRLVHRNSAHLPAENSQIEISRFQIIHRTFSAARIDLICVRRRRLSTIEDCAILRAACAPGRDSVAAIGRPVCKRGLLFLAAI